MRLSLQGCLILWLCLFSVTANAAPFYVSNDQWHSGPTWYGSAAEICSYLDNKVQDGYTSYPCEYPQTDTRTVGIDGVTYTNLPYHRFEVPVAGTGNPVLYAYDFAGVDNPPTPCEPPNYTDPDTGECLAPDQPEECYENGEIYDAEYGRCVLECPNGQLNGVCLQDTAENTDDCNADSSDYKGFIGNGSTKHNLCTSNMECDGGAFGVVNGTPACIPDEYGPPTCDNQGVIVIDEYGFVCSDPEDQPEEPETPEAPNTDTDGDGEPDDYQRENDPESVDKGLDKVREGISDTNSKIDGTNDRLDNVGKGISQLNKNINEGLGKANSTLDDINQKMDGPSEGYSTEGKGTAPTFEETTNRFQTLLTQHPTIQAVTTIPTIAENNTCPVWTIPSTDYWSAMPLDTHCDILNSHRGLLSLLFIAAWTLAAIFVFLRA
ncbi:DUF948 domain-containing protein [Marinobacter arenosus]|uniref:DUF948 domain-containing protein n=1 Tax=Marinobacter arenosus TaxID=2856822 RepID=UPI001C4BD730|nr:DUF948 domain-containing protein [Marinobacter arenosus]MBW0147502.1 hypothetical protein [Marinobacter arenosus]